MALKVYFFVDSCIPLSLIFDQPFKREVEKFLRDVEKYGFQCFMSSSVYQECENLFSRINSLIDNTLRGVIARFEKEKGSDPKISRNDMLILEDFFGSRFWGRQGQWIEQEVLRAIQIWFVEKVEEKLRAVGAKIQRLPDE